MLWTWTFATHHQVESRCVSERPFPIDMKLHKCDDSPRLTTSMQQFWHWTTVSPFCQVEMTEKYLFQLCQSPLSLQSSAWTWPHYYFCFYFLPFVSDTTIYNNAVNSIFPTQSSFYYQKHDSAKLSSPLESPGLQNLFLLLVCLVSAKRCISQQAPWEIWTTTSRMCTDRRKKERKGLERDLFEFCFVFMTN